MKDNKFEQKHKNSSVKYKKDHKPNLQTTFKRVDTESFDSSYKKYSPMTAGGVNKKWDIESSESLPVNNLFDVTFIVGQGKNKTRLFGVRAMMAVRSRYLTK